MKNYKIVIADQKKVMLDLKEQFESEGFVFSTSRLGGSVSASPFADELVRFDLLLPEECMNSALLNIHSLPLYPFFLFVARIDNAAQLSLLEKGVQSTLDRLNFPRSPGDFSSEKSDKIDLSSKSGHLVKGPITVIPYARKAFVNGGEIVLTPIEFDLLKLMVSNSEKVFTRRELSMTLSKPSTRISLKSINSHVYHLRKKISRFLPGREIIRTVYGSGYALKITEEETINSCEHAG